jgi:transcription elongation factor Elf1
MRLTGQCTVSLEAETWSRYIYPMAETFKCPHCGALYEIITDEKTVSEDKDAADCRVCGKQMDVTKGLSIRRYELVKMPDGTNV